jgi:hypothetical protein
VHEPLNRASRFWCPLVQHRILEAVLVLLGEVVAHPKGTPSRSAICVAAMVAALWLVPVMATQPRSIIFCAVAFMSAR